MLGAHGYAIYFGNTSSGNIIHNSGAIHGGILDNSSQGGNHVINSGTIDGLDFYGVNLDLLTGKVLHIINSGTIAGAAASIHSQSGALDLANTGTVAGSISLVSNDADAIYNKGVIVGAVFLGGGKDIFIGTGGGSSAVFGEAGNDHLVGSAQSDTLNGGADDDHLFGEGGSDTLTGGAGVDNFVFDSGLAAGVDFITDFEHGIDHIELKHAIFTKTNLTGVLAKGMFFAGAHAHDANDRIIYNPTNGWLIYDKNGNAGGGATHFATLHAHLGLSAVDFLIV
jgi:Ca2+-binding RTX toxin-like protein